MQLLKKIHLIFKPRSIYFVKFLFFCCLLIVFEIIFLTMRHQLPQELIELAETQSHFYNFDNITLPPKGFLVWSENCRIPSQKLFPKELIENYFPYQTVKCTDKEPFVKKVYDLNLHQYRLIINNNRPEYKDHICCYKEIEFMEDGEAYRSFPCIKFSTNFLVPRRFNYGIVVQCNSSSSKFSFYRDAFFFFQEKMSNVKNFTNDVKEKTGANISILIIGIDGLSQFTFRQTMPHTFAFMQRNGWFELSGYNKVGHHTFPNVMALLSGLNLTGTTKYCKHFYNTRFSDNCNLIFEKFRKYGYLTAYSEDQTFFQTFKGGFQKAPTDFYMMPMLRIFEYESKVQHLCTAERITATIVLDGLSEFVLHNKNYPKFGLFWMNSATHGTTVRSSSLDKHMLNYIKNWENEGLFENNVFIFLSDHGVRWGEFIRYNNIFYEERLPLMFIWLPPYIREKYPEFIYALTVNKNRLTSPFDIFMTLQHLLSLGVVQMPIEAAEGCSNCQTVLRPILENRSCKEVGIPVHLCTCVSYFSVDSKLDLLFNIVNLIIEDLNNFLSKYYKFLCKRIKLKKITKAEAKSHYIITDPKEYKKLNLEILDPKNEGLLFRVVFKIKPLNWKYEVSFVYFKDQHNVIYDIDEDIKLIDRYENVSHCVKDFRGKQFCICIKS